MNAGGDEVRVDESLRSLPDVAGRALGGSVVWCNDEFFADVHALITAAPPTHDLSAYAARGKVYDGWETRRRRTPGDDEAIVRLAAPALVRSVVVDTAFFRGNFPEAAAIDGVALLGHPGADQLRNAAWQPLVDWTPLQGDALNVLPVDGPERLVTHVRLRIRPDGGVARLRVLGEVVSDPRWLGGRPDLAATLTGGRVLDCSNMFYSSPANVLAPGRATVMSDGWETARRRGPGNDWLEVALAVPGLLHDVVVDTTRFVGNAPGWARLSDAGTGRELLPRTALVPDTVHRFRLLPGEPVSAVRLDIYPDGGVSRFHVHGEVAPEVRAAAADRWLSLLPPDEAARVHPDELRG
ncbi:allantoicase [Blastococcus sp. LR1]|uniref:allantoicase n=1 Tax=Blastococcus sp. LR1 TaxID=2877000 RepID=UPI001CCDD65A|nr:allantoicase [Blastococcus sp. LR1]MCA0145359.1 allantoicase [Blastococcus sp. LR1]